MIFSKTRPIKVVMIGTGGTGGHIAPHLYRLLYALDRPVKFMPQHWRKSSTGPCSCKATHMTTAGTTARRTKRARGWYSCCCRNLSLNTNCLKSYFAFSIFVKNAVNN